MSDGSFKFLRDVEIGDQIVSWDGEQFVKDTVKNIWSTGVKKTKQVRAGRSLPLITSQDHVFAHASQGAKTLTWSPLHEIGPSRHLVLYSGLDNEGIRNDELAEFWGYMLSDGYVSGYQQPKFTNTNKTILDRVEYLATKLFDVAVIWRPKGNGYDLGLSNKTKGGGTFTNPVKELFRKEGLDMPKSQRRLPSELWSYSRTSLYRFFAALISSDGNIYCRKAKGRFTPSVDITFNCGQSYDHAWGIYWLLRKIGVIPQQPYKERGSNWKIKVSRNESVYKLLDYAPIIYGKEEQQKRALAVVIKLLERHDHLVTTSAKRVRNSRFKVTDAGDEELYDLETETHHNFVANGYLVHNSGKDIVAWNYTICQAFTRVGLYWYIFCTYNQGKKVLFDGMTNHGSSFLSYIPEELIAAKNASELKITLINGSILQVVGSADIDKLRGGNPAGIVYSEAAYHKPDVFSVLSPILARNNGWQLYITTPFGHNFFYDLWENAQKFKDDWFTLLQTIDDTGEMTREEMEKEIEMGLISREMAQQEYLCSFSTGAATSYYATYINDMRLDGRIGEVMHDPYYPVNTVWDIGMRDSTALICYQVINNVVHIIDAYESSSQPLEHYIKALQEKGRHWTWGKHFAPHDIAVREWGTGLTRGEKAEELGFRFELRDGSSVIPNVSIADGIEMVRTMFSRCKIDEVKCKDLIKALENYQKEYNDERKVFSNKPLHSWASHYSDSLRYLALSLPMLKTGMTEEDAQRLRVEALYSNRNNLPTQFNMPNY